MDNIYFKIHSAENIKLKIILLALKIMILTAKSYFCYGFFLYPYN